MIALGTAIRPAALTRGRGTKLAPGAILGALPPPALILAGIVSVQVGAGLARQLFAVVPPAAVTLLRLWSSAIVMLVPVITTRLRRRGSGGPGHRGSGGVPRTLRCSPGLARRDRGVSGGRSPGLAERIPWRSFGVAAMFGLTLAAMNFAIYQSFARIPLGVAVTIEFLGPLGVAVAASRRLIDLGWVVLAASGVALLTRGGGHLTVTGIAFALVAAMCWAAYILLSAATGRRFPGSAGLTIAMAVAAVAIAPVGIAAGGSAMFRPQILAIGAGIGLLSSVIPYSLELEALRRIPPRVFGILMSLEPAVAALVGLVLLGQLLTGAEWIAVGCVMVACIGATRGAARPGGQAPDLTGARAETSSDHPVWQRGSYDEQVATDISTPGDAGAAGGPGQPAGRAGDARDSRERAGTSAAGDSGGATPAAAMGPGMSAPAGAAPGRGVIARIRALAVPIRAVAAWLARPVWQPTAQSVRDLALATVVVNAGIIVTGAGVRLSESGLGCPDWPKCTAGSLVATRTPGQTALNTWIEFGNRLLTFAVAAVAVAVLVAAWRLRVPGRDGSPVRRGELVRLAAVLAVGVVVQAVIGGISVLTKLDPAVVSVHFLFSMAMVAVAVLLYVRSGEDMIPARPLVRADLRVLSGMVIAIAGVMFAAGTVVTGTGPLAGNAAAKRYHLPLEGVTQLHADIGWLFGGLAIALAVGLKLTGAPQRAIRLGWLLLAAMAVQGAVGYTQYFTGLPPGLVWLHVLGSVLVWITALLLFFALRDRGGRPASRAAQADRAAQVASFERSTARQVGVPADTRAQARPGESPAVEPARGTPPAG